MSKSSGSVAAKRFMPAMLLAIGLSTMALSAVPAVAGSKAPLGFQLMCLRTPAECQGGGKSQVQATVDIMTTLKKVNSRVNRSIAPQRDGAADTWNANAAAGDCEDYVLAKRRALIKAGLPASSLRIAYVKTRQGEGHAILVVKTSDGEFVLDNLRSDIRPLRQSGYRIISMSGADPKRWS